MAGSASGAWYSAENWIDKTGVTFDASDEVATMTATNVSKRQVARRWRVDELSTGATDFTVDIDLKEPRAIEVVAVVTPRVNDNFSDDDAPILASTDTFRHEFSNVAATNNEAYDSGVINTDILKGYGYHVHILPSEITAQYYRLTVDAISRDTTPNNYVDIGRIWLGSLFEFTIGFGSPMGYAWTSNSRATRSLKSVAEYVDRRDPFRFISTVFRRITPAERNTLIDFERKTTNTSQILFGLNVTDPNRDAMLCRNESRGLEQTNFANYRREFALTESL